MTCENVERTKLPKRIQNRLGEQIFERQKKMQQRPSPARRSRRYDVRLSLV